MIYSMAESCDILLELDVEQWKQGLVLELQKGFTSKIALVMENEIRLLHSIFLSSYCHPMLMRMTILSLILLEPLATGF